MMNFLRLKNKFIAKMISHFPSLAKKFIDAYTPWESEDIPWTPVTTPLKECHVAMVTTSGVHHNDQKPFNMHDPNGDPTFRVIDSTRLLTNYQITHDYYNHADADNDINIVFPLERLKEFETDAVIGRVANTHYSFMGHIDGSYIYDLINISAKEIATRLKTDGIDVVLLTPG